MNKPRVDAFLDLVRRSGLVEADQLDEVLSTLKEQAGGKPLTDARLVAERLTDAGLVTGWQCARLMEGRYKGFFLKKYKLLDHLGTGGMSQVYLAEHVLMQRRVAIKILPRHRVEDTSYLARFHREAQAAASLDHRNIVRAYDVDSDGGVHYLVMEYVEGRDLQAMVKADGPMEYASAAEYIRQAAEGLSHAHRAGLIHRDIKPANLLVDHSGVLKVLDLGLARFTNDEEQASLTMAYDENLLGTADYLPPEQALNSHLADARSDIYSLGCSLYYLLCGHPPFSEGTLTQRLMMHQKEPPPSIFKDRPDAPEDLVGICLRMMEKNPDERYQSAAEVADALADWLITAGYSGNYDSAIGGGSDSGSSSSKLAAAAFGRAAARQRTGPTPLPGRSQPVNPPVRPAGTRGPQRAWPSPEQREPGSDTDSNLDRLTVKSILGAPGLDRPTHPSDSRTSNRKELPVARPLQAEPPPGSAGLPELREPLSGILADRPLEELLAEDKFSNLVEGEPVGPLTSQQLKAYLDRHQHTPPWIWVVISVTSVVVLILLTALVLRG